MGLILALAASPLISAQAPVQVIASSGVPAPVDRPFSGAITLDVDATDIGHRIFRVSERVPVQGPGPVTLLYPQWEAASQGPSISVVDLAGLEVRAGGRLLPWRRDPVEPHAFRVQPPPGRARWTYASRWWLATIF